MRAWVVTVQLELPSSTYCRTSQPPHSTSHAELLCILTSSYTDCPVCVAASVYLPVYLVIQPCSKIPFLCMTVNAVKTWSSGDKDTAKDIQMIIVMLRWRSLSVLLFVAALMTVIWIRVKALLVCMQQRLSDLQRTQCQHRLYHGEKLPGFIVFYHFEKNKWCLLLRHILFIYIWHMILLFILRVLMSNSHMINGTSFSWQICRFI